MLGYAAFEIRISLEWDFNYLKGFANISFKLYALWRNQGVDNLSMYTKLNKIYENMVLKVMGFR